MALVDAVPLHMPLVPVESASTCADAPKRPGQPLSVKDTQALEHPSCKRAFAGTHATCLCTAKALKSRMTCAKGGARHASRTGTGAATWVK